MGWGNKTPGEIVGNSGFGNTRVSSHDLAPRGEDFVILPPLQKRPHQVMLLAKEHGVSLTDIREGCWRVSVQGETGVHTYTVGQAMVYTTASPSSPLGRILDRLEIRYGAAPEGGWY